ncbi:MAG: DHHA1 domain-containing protein [Methanoregula sp.]|nr:DHHA1 domain-containing protein [Methanoregula sp.]
MSLDTAAETVAGQIRRQEFIEVLAHHDADGIAAASILCHAMLRSGIRFRLRVRQEITAKDLAGDDSFLLCDLGAGMGDLPHNAIVVDHHLPVFDGEFHANPRLASIDGDRELSAAGTAYIVAQKMGDNRDLAGLVIPGILGDGQEMTGKNLEIFNEAITNGIIVPDRGLTLPGRDITERFYTSISPYLEGVSGNEELISTLINQSAGTDGIRLDNLLSQVLISAAPGTTPSGMRSIYGDTYHLQREVIEDAHALTAVIDACGKAGRGDLGLSLCLRSSHDIDRAWEIARKHRVGVIDAIRSAHPAEGTPGVFEVKDATLASDVADVFARDRVNAQPVLVYARDGKFCRISARCPAGIEHELGPLLKTLALANNGHGGGHNRRAGATIPCDQIGAFTKAWHEAVVS